MGKITRKEIKAWEQFCQQVQSSTAAPINENEAEQQTRITKAKKDYRFFFETYLSIYATAPCAQFQIKAVRKAINNKNSFNVWEWPREHAKSVHADVGFPLWLLAREELTGMVLVGKNNNDASSLLADIQAQLQFNELFQHDFGEQYNMGSWEDGNFATKDNVRFVALGRGQSPRGIRRQEKRPNLAVIDDIDDDEIVNNLSRVRKVVEWIFGALYFALSIKGARVVMAGNRIHNESILAHVVGDTKPGAPKRKGINHSKVKAIDSNNKPAWPERYSLKELTQKITTAGPTAARREFFHENQIEGSIFKEKYFQWKQLPQYKSYDLIVGYFDPSFENKSTSDYKAISVWGIYKDELHCIDRFVRRCELGEAFAWMVQFEEKLPEGCNLLWYVEKQFFNRPVQEALKSVNRAYKSKLVVIQDPRQKPNKYTRIVRMEPQYSLGTVYYNVRKKNDTDMIEGNNQLKGIEPGYNGADDAPDADEGAWYYLLPHMQQEQDFEPIFIRPKYAY